jgi:nucleoside-diphosphate-sugar epimerase
MDNNSLVSVFGGWGFVGSELCKDPDFIRNEPNRYDYRNKFLSDYPDMVFCISTVTNYNVLDNDPYVDIQTNLHHMISVLQANKLKYGNDFTFNFISTWFVYGQVELPAREDSCCAPKGFYSITKRAAEQLLMSYCETFGIKWRIIRLCNVLGEDDAKVSKRRNALQYMIKTLCAGGEIDLYDEDCQRDYLHVSDVANAIQHIVRKGNYGEIYNVGSGYPNSIHRMVNYAHRLSNYLGKINLVPVPAFHKTVQALDMYLDTSKLSSLGWTPKYTADEVVEMLCEYYLGGK